MKYLFWGLIAAYVLAKTVKIEVYRFGMDLADGEDTDGYVFMVTERYAGKITHTEMDTIENLVKGKGENHEN